MHMDLMGQGGVHSVQVGKGDELSEQIRALVNTAMQETATACIQCGQPGTLDKSSSWVLVLCDEHAKQRRKGKLGRTWLEDNEQ